MSDNRKTINAEPHHVEVQMPADGRFVLTVHSEKHKIHLHFDRWWISFIAMELWKVIKSEREKLDRVESDLKGKP